MKNLFFKTKFLLYVSIFLGLILQFKLFGQDQEDLKSLYKELNSVIKLIESNNYHQAVIDAQKLYVNSSDRPEVCLILGLSYINLGSQPDSAVYYLKEGIDLLSDEEQYSETGINLHLSLAKAYQMALVPEEAISIYDQLLKEVNPENSGLINEIQREKQTCYNAKILLQNPIALKITNLGSKINSEYDDHSPLYSMKDDKIYFTSRRQQHNLSLLEDGQYPEKICVSEQSESHWSDPTQLDHFYRRNEHESALSLSADGKTMFLFRFDMDGKNLYSSYLKDGEWSSPKKLPEPINSYYNETHCSLTADESTLFFTSDREGGYGGLDIYMVKKLTNGTWGEAKNLGPNINTQYDEETPMIYLDGKTLYFASEGHNSMGMYDIFYSHMNSDSTWDEPVNLGFPINTPGDDFFFVPTIDRNKAYYASAKFSDNVGGIDIYQVEFDSDFKGELAVIEGKIDQDGTTKTVRILVSRVEDQVLVGDYRPDPVTGEYTMFLETGNRYQIKEVRQTIDEVVVGEIEVPEEMAYVENNSMIVMKDIKMEPPLSPAERLIRQKSEKEKILATSEETGPMTPDTNSEFTSPDDTIKLTNESYTIQLLALKTKRLHDYSIFEGLDLSKIREYICTDGFCRYTYNSFDDKERSLGERKSILRSGKWQDAFVRPVMQIEELSYPLANN